MFHLGGSKVDKKYLIFLVVNPLSELGLKLDALTLIEFTEKHTVLSMIADRETGFKNTRSPFVIRDVVGDEIAAAGHVQRVVIP